MNKTADNQGYTTRQYSDDVSDSGDDDIESPPPLPPPLEGPLSDISNRKRSSEESLRGMRKQKEQSLIHSMKELQPTNEAQK